MKNVHSNTKHKDTKTDSKEYYHQQHPKTVRIPSRYCPCCHLYTAHTSTVSNGRETIVCECGYEQSYQVG